jgi:hypothetical protein
MRRSAKWIFGVAGALLLAQSAMAQDSQAAATTRKKLATKISIDIKEVGTKAFLDELNLELDKPFRFVIDNASGVSNNTKMTYKGKDVPVSKILNDLADKYDWGYFVKSDAGNNKVDGAIVIRKSTKGKERGYEAGKEPKKAADKSSRIDVNTPWSERPRMIAAVSASVDPAAYRQRA